MKRTLALAALAVAASSLRIGAPAQQQQLARSQAESFFEVATGASFGRCTIDYTTDKYEPLAEVLIGPVLKAPATSARGTVFKGDSDDFLRLKCQSAGSGHRVASIGWTKDAKEESRAYATYTAIETFAPQDSALCPGTTAADGPCYKVTIDDSSLGQGAAKIRRDTAIRSAGAGLRGPVKNLIFFRTQKSPIIKTTKTFLALCLADCNPVVTKKSSEAQTRQDTVDSVAQTNPPQPTTETASGTEPLPVEIQDDHRKSVLSRRSMATSANPIQYGHRSVVSSLSSKSGSHPNVRPRSLSVDSKGRYMKNDVFFNVHNSPSSQHTPPEYSSRHSVVTDPDLHQLEFPHRDSHTSHKDNGVLVNQLRSEVETLKDDNDRLVLTNRRYEQAHQDTIQFFNEYFENQLGGNFEHGPIKHIDELRVAAREAIDTVLAEHEEYLVQQQQELVQQQQEHSKIQSQHAETIEATKEEHARKLIAKKDKYLSKLQDAKAVLAKEMQAKHDALKAQMKSLQDAHASLNTQFTIVWNQLQTFKERSKEQRAEAAEEQEFFVTERERARDEVAKLEHLNFEISLKLELQAEALKMSKEDNAILQKDIAAIIAVWETVGVERHHEFVSEALPICAKNFLLEGSHH